MASKVQKQVEVPQVEIVDNHATFQSKSTDMYQLSKKSKSLLRLPLLRRLRKLLTCPSLSRLKCHKYRPSKRSWKYLLFRLSRRLSRSHKLETRCLVSSGLSTSSWKQYGKWPQL